MRGADVDVDEDAEQKGDGGAGVKRWPPDPAI
jgi:hypothetical protein